MRAYVGQSRGAKMISALRELGYGEMTVRGEFPPRRTPWAFDNGAFRDWKAGNPFQEARFYDELARCAEHDTPPDFVVCPDLVADPGSYAYSCQHVARVRKTIPGVPVYLAGQDGMEGTWWQLDHFDGLFMGGTIPWKLRYGAQAADAAHRRGKPAHAGRVGTARRVRWAKDCGFDSIDSCLPLWSEDQLRRFRVAMDDQHPSLFV